MSLNHLRCGLAGGQASDREFLLSRQRLDDDAARWQGGGRDPELLLRDAELDGVLKGYRDVDFNAAEIEFISACLEANSRARTQRKVRNSWLVVLAGLIAASFLEVVRASPTAWNTLGVLAALVSGSSAFYLSGNLRIRHRLPTLYRWRSLELVTRAGLAIAVFILVWFLWVLTTLFGHLPAPGLRFRGQPGSQPTQVSPRGPEAAR